MRLKDSIQPARRRVIRHPKGDRPTSPRQWDVNHHDVISHGVTHSVLIPSKLVEVEVQDLANLAMGLRQRCVGHVVQPYLST